jgi:hypothetical protein
MIAAMLTLMAVTAVLAAEISGLTQYEFGFAWLTPEGMEIAIQELGLPCAEHMEAAE